MTGKGGKRGGLFGQVMESTAKLINSNDIGVRFKCVILFYLIYNIDLCYILLYFDI